MPVALHAFGLDTEIYADSFRAPCKHVKELDDSRESYDAGKRTSGKMNTAKLYYRVDRRRINMVRFIFEAYEGVAVVTTLDAASGAIVLAIAPGCEKTAQAVMVDLGRHFMVELSAPPGFETKPK